MKYSLLFRMEAHTVAIVLFAGMICAYILGRILARSWHARKIEPDGEGLVEGGGVGAILGALFALFGLILAFTFGMSGSRYEGVRNIMIEEANDIGTVILRTDLYPDSMRKILKEELKNYVEARISYYDHASDLDKFQKAKEDADKSGGIVWTSVSQFSKLQPNLMVPNMQMIPALNSMLDIATTRDVMLKSRVPDAIVITLFVLTLTISFIGGFTTPKVGSKDWVVIVGFAMLTALIIYLTLDLGRPMRGFIKLDQGQQALVDLRKLF
jgi:hypothetical protein